MRLSSYRIDGEACRRCGRCERVCPHGAIQPGEAGPSIDQQRCRRCGMCFRACAFHAVRRPYRLLRLRDLSTTGRGE